MAGGMTRASKGKRSFKFALWNRSKFTIAIFFPRQRVLDIGRLAASAGRPISIKKQHQQAASWLVERNLATYTSQGQIVLLSAALQTVTKLQDPVLVSGPANNCKNSVWGLRRKLAKEGWRAGPPSSSSIDNHVFNDKNSFRQYLSLLLDRI